MNSSLTVNQSLMHGCSGEVKASFPAAERSIYGAFLVLQLVLSTFGNTLVCFAIFRFQHLRTLSNTFIFSLAITDLLTPPARVLYVAVSMLSKKWVFGCFWCGFSSVLGIFLCASSILHLCAISIERFITIKWPLRYQNWITRPRVISVIVNIWITSLLLSLFPYFGIVHHTFNVEVLDCEISYGDNPKMAVVLAVFFFLLPFLLMVLTYCYIFKEVWRQTNRISTVQTTQAERIRRKSTGTRMRINHILKNEFKAVRIIVIVIGVFFVFWLPWFLVNCLRAYRPNGVSGTVQRLTFALAYTNSSCNWIIYSVMNRQLREAFKATLIGCGNTNAAPYHETSSFRRIANGIRAANIAIRPAINKIPSTTPSSGEQQQSEDS